MHGAGSLPPNAARISKIFCAQPCNRPSLQIQIFPRSEETKPLRSTPIDIIPSFIPRINFSFLSENRERMDTLSSQTTPIPAILSLYRLQMFSFARLISFVDRSSVISSIQRTRLDPFSFHHFSRYTFLLNEIIVHRRETLFHTHASIVCGRAGRRVYCNPKCSSRLLRQDERPSCTGCWPGPTTGEPW